MEIYVSPDYVQELGEDGPFTATKFHVEAVYYDGRRYHHFKLFDRLEDAERLKERIEFAGKLIKPESSDYWIRGFDVYGSTAFEANNGEGQLAKADVEAEYGPGTYQTNHPGYIGPA